MVEFAIDIEKVKLSDIIFEQLIDYIELSDESLFASVAKTVSSKEPEDIAVALIDNLGADKTLKYIREATKPKHAIFVAVLDSRTTDICRGNDGKRWLIDNTNIPYPPLHFGCRSSVRYE